MLDWGKIPGYWPSLKRGTLGTPGVPESLSCTGRGGVFLTALPRFALCRISVPGVVTNPGAKSEKRDTRGTT